ncbi:MAG TPA: hypothetical protein VG734_02605 [Lacunisphaera sp.]|nr:hypothetical protein [Lacunisphaera sp.]
MPTSPPSPPFSDDDRIDFAGLFTYLRRGLRLILSLAALGLAAGIAISLLLSYKQAAVSTLRVTFGFSGFERGTYPNGAKFQPDDIRAPDIVNEAIKHLGVHDLTPDLATKVRGAIGVSGIVSQNIIKERDKLRAAGQNLPPYFPDEYEISLSLPRDFILDVRQRELLLAEIVNVYLEKFRRTYADLPPQFGNAFDSLNNADFVEYELVLTKEMQNLHFFLEQKIDAGDESQHREPTNRLRTAKIFRSPTNNLSFQDLLKQTELFTQIQLNEVLSQIYIYGLSKDRDYALTKMNYYMRTLEDQEQQLKEEEAVVTGLLARTQERSQNYVLATKTQQPQSAQPMLDQGFIDALLANDAYNFLIRRALDAGLAVKRVQGDIARLADRRKRMQSFTNQEGKDQAAVIASTREALGRLEKSYQELISKIRVVLDDYARQEYADSVRITMQAKTSSLLLNLMLGSAVGVAFGLAIGAGLSLLKPAPALPPASSA